ncbi:branched-chain amino acid ABC transporter permease [Fodinicurvata sp. EGI_FJ10296]|uniref:branched-chain amino acid ABC transporter permease n=1 Tax=Fodinicurvata sp. EGI_FJ10296 TaxID=3231908 RepID=UPI0034567B57
MIEIPGLLNYLIFAISMAGIYSVLALGLNIQWGLTGQLNIGVAGFFAVGAYTAAILSGPDSPNHLGGFGIWFPIALLGGVVMAGLVALVIALITVNLRTDYLAIATIGIAEIIRLFFTNEAWLTYGVRGMNVDRPLQSILPYYNIFSMAFVVLVVAGVYFLAERLRKGPWGRVLRGIRESEPAVQAAGKNINRFRIEAFVIGSMFMGLGGGIYAHFVGFISPEALDPMFTTFLVWVMLIAGGSGSNRGAIVGAFVIWAVWSLTPLLTGLLPSDMSTQASSLRTLLVGVLLIAILRLRPEGILGEIAEIRRERGSSSQ